MVEVFKTNVNEKHQAEVLVKQIQFLFHHYVANFDLHDCDKILRVRSTNGKVANAEIIQLVNHWGFEAEVLPD